MSMPWRNKEFYRFRASPKAHAILIAPENNDKLLEILDEAVHGLFQSEENVQRTGSRGFAHASNGLGVIMVSDCDTSRNHTVTLYLAEEMPSRDWAYYRFHELPGEGDMLLIDLATYQ